VRGDAHLARLLSEALVPGFEHELTGGNSVDVETPILTTDREPRIVRDHHVRDHPRVDVAREPHDSNVFREGALDRSGARRLGLIEECRGANMRVDIVKRVVARANDKRLSADCGLDARLVLTLLLVHLQRASWCRNAWPVRDSDNDVAEFAVTHQHLLVDA